MKLAKILVALTVLLLCLWVTGHQLSAVAQQSGEQETIEGVPPAALLTQRGRQLADELRSLLRAKGNMGPKHPNLSVVEGKIADIKSELKAWAPEQSPFSGERENPKINDSDLRQLVLQLTKKVEQLEKRVAALEAK